MKLKVSKFIATFFGAGYSPFAPGTAGAIVAFMISCGFIYFNLSEPTILYAHIGLSIFCIIIGIIATKNLEKVWGHDPSKIVIDEAIGIWITFLFISPSYLNFFIGLLLFRFFDILKPLGIKYFDKMNTPASVIFDDVLAGIYANISLVLILKYVL
jgi:phosphatidylglycerophosphatase A